jgi:iron(III) transport system substrate-binding protein
MKEPERTDALLKAAKKEGEVTIYGTDSLGVDIGDAFTKKYGIKVNFLDGESDETVAKIIQEADAGRHSVDVTNGGQPMLEQLEAKGLLGDYGSRYREQVNADGKGKGWTGYRRQPFVVAYNTSVVDPKDIPPDLLGFADPKWKDKIAVVQNDYDWYMGMVMYYQSKGMPRADIDATFKKIAANARIIDSHSNLGPLLAAGQYGVALSSYVHHVAQVAKKHAPVEWRSSSGAAVQPIVMRYEGVALMNQAAHPAAATLFLDFVLGPGGEQVVSDQNQLPAIPAADGDPLTDLHVVLMDNHEFATNSPYWSKSWDDLLRSTR